MSYEGYVQRICEAGHLSRADAYDDPSTCFCGHKVVFRNSVDQTNGDDMGIIPAFELQKLLLSREERTACPTCGACKVTQQALYRVPSEGELKFMRHYREHDGVLHPLVTLSIPGEVTFEEYASDTDPFSTPA